MKRVLFALAVLLPVFWSCDKSVDNFEEQKEDEYITLPISVKGEILTTSEMPLTRTSDSKEIYIIEVFYSSNKEGKYSPYARGVFNDISSTSIKLKKNLFYSFRITCHRSPLNDIRTTGNGYRVLDLSFQELHNKSFNSGWGGFFNNNDFVYSQDSYDGFYCDGFGRLGLPFRAYSDALNPTLVYNLDTYSSYLIGFNPSENTSIDFYMTRIVYGFRFEVDNLSEGTLEIEFGPHFGSGFQITLTPMNPQYESYSLFYQLQGLSFDDKALTDYTWKIREDYFYSPKLSIIFIDESGNSFPVYSGDSIPFTRNKMKVINIHLDQEAGSEEVPMGMSVKFEEAPMVEESPITISQ